MSLMNKQPSGSTPSKRAGAGARDRHDAGRHVHLAEECAASVRWVTANLGFLGLQEQSSKLILLERVHVLTELGLAYSYLSQWQSGELSKYLLLDDELAQWQEKLVQTCTSDKYISMVRDHPWHGIDLMQLYMWMRSAGYHCSRNEETMAYLKRLGFGPETVGQLHSLWKAGYVRQDPGWTGLCQSYVSVLDEQPAASTTKENVYELTHAVFYATDFGNHQVSLEAQQRAQALRVMNRLLSYWSSVGDWDITSELLASLNCLGANNIAAAGALAKARLHDGGIPVDCTMAAQTSEQEKTFWRCRHTTLIDALRCAISINTLVMEREENAR
jgi:hypothetical protein